MTKPTRAQIRDLNKGADDTFDPLVWQRGFDAGMKAERERCALIAENYAVLSPSSDFVVQTTMEVAAESIAAAIRALKDK